MTKLSATLFITFLAVTVSFVQKAAAVPISDTFVWYNGRVKVVEVEVTFYPEEDLAGSDDLTPGVADGLYLYSVTNLYRDGDLEPMPCVPPCERTTSISAFVVPNPDHLDGVMFGPEGWSGHVDAAGRFVWEARAHTLGPSETERFLLFSPGPYGVLTSPPYRESEVGLAIFGPPDAGARVFGPVSGPLLAPQVPEPCSALLLGLGLAGLGLSPRVRRVRPLRRTEPVGRA